ncbi:hypothetical protein DFJ67_7848 [Asanoa ferruginea]|uniref:Uncharacterized protein n=1 Tax=Asanoa ferruginea TaxID=53367 RepID=A0A3E0A5S7_9ACTN|nr:hypothetical protein [Asanoa ferruginea]REG01761.1 hypothetical protein DFJ67_7848 [Asanoa ferruginea]GIF49206.1 hypothetical protein Afe04nite_37450 [Asanoa ferruginea]
MALIDLDSPPPTPAGSAAVALMRKLAVLVAVGLVLAVPGEPYRATPVPVTPVPVCEAVETDVPIDQLVQVDVSTGAFIIMCQN